MLFFLFPPFVFDREYIITIKIETRFVENKRTFVFAKSSLYLEPQRPYDHLYGGFASVALICVRKRRISFLPKTLLWRVDGDGDGGDGGGRISPNLQPPFPSRPGITYPIRAPALTPILKY